MPGVGTLIDMSGIIAGGATALVFGRLFSEQMKNMLMMVCGLSVFIIGITGIMQGMLTVSGGTVSVKGSIPLLISLVVGAAIGEALGIERGINRLGELLQKQVKQEDGKGFADGYGPDVADDDWVHHDHVSGNQSNLEQGNPCRKYAADGCYRCYTVLYTGTLIQCKLPEQ